MSEEIQAETIDNNETTADEVEWLIPVRAAFRVKRNKPVKCEYLQRSPRRLGLSQGLLPAASRGAPRAEGPAAGL